MNTLEQKKARRFLVLEQAYRLSDGNREKEFDQQEVENVLGLTQPDVDALVTYLVDEGLLEYLGNGRFLTITHRGVREYETAISKPATPTHYFPPVNIIHIERMEQSQIQQGTVSSSQTQATTAVNSVAIEALVREIRAASLTLSPTDRDTFESDLATVEAQLKRPEPRSSIIRESFTSARAILEGAGAALLAGKIAHLLAQTL